MGVIAEMVVNVTARTEKFRKGMAQSDKVTKQFGKTAGGLGKQVEGLTGRLHGFTLGLGGVVTTIGTATVVMTKSIAITRQMAAEFDKLGKSAEKLGLTAAGLQTLQFAGELSGIGPEKLGTSIQRMARKIGDASRGIGEAKKTFEQLGVDFERLAGMQADEQFLEVAEAISKLDGHTAKLSATVKVFDSEGAELIRMLSLGKGGIAELREELQRMGLLLDDQTLAQFAALNDASTRLGKTWEGLKLTLSKELAPALTALAGDLGSLVQGFNRMANLKPPAWWKDYMGLKRKTITPPQLAGLDMMLTAYGAYRKRGMAAAGRDEQEGSAGMNFPGLMPSGLGGPGGIMGGMTNRTQYLTRGATRLANLLGRTARFGQGLSGGVTAAGLKGQWQSWRGIIGGMARNFAGGDGGLAGLNPAIRSGSLEAQAARARARSDRSRVPEQQLKSLRELVTIAKRLAEAAAAAGRPIIEEVTL